MWYQKFFKMKKKKIFFLQFFIFSLKVISIFLKKILKNTLRGPVNWTLKTIVVSLKVFLL